MSPRRTRRSPRNRKAKSQSSVEASSSLPSTTQSEIAEHVANISSPPQLRLEQYTDTEGVTELQNEFGSSLSLCETEDEDTTGNEKGQGTRIEANAPTYEYLNYPSGFPYLLDSPLDTIHETDIEYEPSEHILDLHNHSQAREIFGTGLILEFTGQQQQSEADAIEKVTIAHPDNQEAVTEAYLNPSLPGSGTTFFDQLEADITNRKDDQQSPTLLVEENRSSRTDELSIPIYWTNNLPFRPRELGSPSSNSTLTGGLRDINLDYLVGLQAVEPDPQEVFDNADYSTTLGDLQNDSTFTCSTDDTIYIAFPSGQSTPTTLDIAISSSSSEAGSSEELASTFLDYIAMGNQNSKDHQEATLAINAPPYPGYVSIESHSAQNNREHLTVEATPADTDCDAQGSDAPQLLYMADVQDGPESSGASVAPSPTLSSISAFELVPKFPENTQPAFTARGKAMSKETDVALRCQLDGHIACQLEASENTPFDRELNLLRCRAQTVIGVPRDALLHISALNINSYHAKARTVEQDLNKLILAIHEASVKHIEGCRQKERLRGQEGWVVPSSNAH